MGKGPEVRAAHPRPSQSRVPPPPGVLTLLVVMKQETSLNWDKYTFKLYIFFLTFIFFVTISILFLTFKGKFKIIPTENVINYYWSWINFDGKLVKKKNVVKSNHLETFSKTSNILAILNCGFKKDFLEPQNKDL